MSRFRDVAAFLTLALVWGLTFSAVETGLSTVPPVLFMAFRYDLGGLLLLGYVVSKADNWRPRTRGDLLAVVAGGVLWTAVGNGIWYVGQELTTSVFSGMMASLIPVMTAAFSWVVLPEDRLTPLSLVGLLVGFVGALVMMLPGDGVAFTASLLGKGIVFSGVCGAALGSVLIRRAEPSISSAAQTAWSVSLGAVLLHALSPVLGETWSGSVSLAAGVALIYLGVFSTLVAYLLYFSLLERHSAIELTLVTYLVPLVAAAAGWLLFDEPVTPSMVGGFLVVVVGFTLMKRQALREEIDRWKASI